MKIRQKLFDMIEISSGNHISDVYDSFMMITILASLVPLAFKEMTPFLTALDRISVWIFIVDYVFRFLTADLKLRKGAASFIIYPFTPMALIDLLCILPFFTPLSGGFHVLKIIRFFRTFRIFRAFKMMRYSKSLMIIIDVVKEQKTPLAAVGSLAVTYILISALVVFNVEPESFNSLFDAIYWATISLTTVGYGDIYPVSNAGRVITMLSSVLGIAIVALPSGIITAGYMSKINEVEKDREPEGDREVEEK